jgi:hypothetical protein
MLTTLPLTTAEIVNTVLPRNAAAKGVVDRKISGDTYVIALAAGKIAVKVPSGSGELSEGDTVAVVSRGNSILIEKLASQPSAASSPSADTVHVQTDPDSAVLRLLADTAAGRLKEQVLDKNTLDQLQRILSAVAKNPSRFGEDTVKAVAELKAIVAAMPGAGADVDQTAQEIVDRIIRLGDTFAEKLKSGAGAVDVVLRSGAKAVEGYYSFDNVKSAIEWLSENKEIRENVPWQKLTQVFGSGPVVIKVYESAIGDKRASFVAPQQTVSELSHFKASSLSADVWKNVSDEVLAKVLYDRKEIPLSRLQEIDALVKEAEQRQLSPPAAAPAEGPDAPVQANEAQSKTIHSQGFTAAFGHWLTIALDEGAPLAQLVSRVPQPSSQQIPVLLSTLGTGDNGTEASSAKAPAADGFSIQQKTLAAAKSPDTVLPDLFRRLGLNLESALSKGNDTDSGMQPQNLKTVLLTLLSSMPEKQNAGTVAPEQTVRNAVSHASAALQRLLSDAAEYAKVLSEKAGAAEHATIPAKDAEGLPLSKMIDKARMLQELPAQIESRVQTILKTASNEVERLVAAFKQAQNTASAQSGAVAAARETAPEAFTRAVQKEISTQLAGEAGKATIVLDQGRAAIIDKMEKLLAAASDRVSVPSAKTSTPSTDAAVQADTTDASGKQLVTILKDVKREIIAFVKNLPEEIQVMARQSTAGLVEVEKEFESLISQTPASPAAKETPQNADMSRVAQNIEAAAKLLDNFSVQTGTDSSRQLVALKQELSDALARVLAQVKQVIDTEKAFSETFTPVKFIGVQPTETASPGQGSATLAFALENFLSDMPELMNTLSGKTTAGSIGTAQTDQAVQQLAVLFENVRQEIIAFVNNVPGIMNDQEETAAVLTGQTQQPSPASAGTEMTPQEQFLLQVARDTRVTVKLLNVLASQTPDEGTSSALIAAKQELDTVLAQISQAHAAEGAAEEPFVARAATSSAPAAAAAATAAAIAASNAVPIETADLATGELSAQLVKQAFTDFDQVIGRLSEQIEQTPSAGRADVRRDAVAHALRQFSADVTERVNTVVREISMKIMASAAQTADVLENAASRNAGPVSPEKHVDTMQTGLSQDDAASSSSVAVQLKKAAQGVQRALDSIETAKGDVFTSRAGEIVRRLQQSVATLADAYTPRPANQPQDPSAAAANIAVKTADAQPENLAATAGRQIMVKVNEIAESMKDLGRQILKIEDALARDAAPKTVAQDKQQADVATKSVKDAFRQLESSARSLADHASSASRETLRRLDDLASQASKQLEPDGRQQRSGLDMLKQQVENALTHVESLQVLARQVVVADGQQQVISLPMKIEGQWTDVVVKFLKKNDSGEKKTAENRPVSVAIHVAPAMLGQIDVFMDYSGKTRFSMRMEFEKPSTREWFENNKTDFSAALSKIGFTAFKIDMKEARPRRQGSDAGSDSPKSSGLTQGVIDIIV